MGNKTKKLNNVNNVNNVILNSKSKKIIIRKKGKTTYKVKNGKSSPVYLFQYIDNKNNKYIKDKSEIERIESLRIPPAYQDVIISKKNTDKVQAIGTDDKGRKQYIYNPKFIQDNQDNKYKNIIKLGYQIEKIKRNIRETLLEALKKEYNQWVQPQTNIAIIVFLLDSCNFRIGNIKYLNLYKSYGASTLKGGHIKMKNGKAHISFIGKKGVFNSSIVNNSIANKVFKILKKVKSKDDILFPHQNSNEIPITPEQVSDFLKEYDENIVPKMFRTWYANYYFLEKIRTDIKNNNEFLVNMLNLGSDYNKMKKRNNNAKENQFQKYKNKYINQCCDYIAERLHNTSNISKKSYLDHQLVDYFFKNTTKFLETIKNNRRISNHQLLIIIINNMNK
jgi:DNA topoisomerase IB